MARVYQLSRDKKKLAELGKDPSKAPWFVQQRNGKQIVTKKIGKKKDAEAVAAQWEYEKRQRRAGATLQKPWATFRDEFRETGMNDMTSQGSVVEMERSLDHLQRIINPRLVADVDRLALDKFVKARLKEPGRNPSDPLSRHTVKKDLRHIKAALNRAHDWGYLMAVPAFPKVKADESEPDFVLMDHFLKMLAHVHVMEFPRKHPDPPAWWTAFLWTVYATGSRVGAVLDARWEWLHIEDIDDGELAVLTFPAGVVKQKKEYAPKVTAALPHLRAIMPEPAKGLIFPWAPHNRRTLDVEFHKLQEAAGIELVCPKADKHECTDACHVYGWHAIRYAHGTYNYGRVPDRELMEQMGHSTRAMMDRYARTARLNKAKMYNLFVPTADPAFSPSSVEAEAVAS
jgi:integrase